MKRAQKQAILADLEKKMVLLVGPRQAGKTWLAREIQQEFSNPVYLNFDQIEDRTIIEQQSWLQNTDLLVLDELHKLPDWKNYLKGLYDTKPTSMRVLVTGSARLNIFTQMGDSLAGRYFLHRLLPISPAELAHIDKECQLETLLTRGGFPEPFLAETDLDAERWRQQYLNSLISTDIFTFEDIQDIKAIQSLVELLRHRVGSPISYTSLAEDLNISSNTVKKYIQILEDLYVIFRITPYSKNIARSLLKEPKLYFFDTGLVKGSAGAKLENLVAVSLLKYCYGMCDYQAQQYKLHYLRTKEKREVDFALVLEDDIERIIEVKNANTDLSKALLYFHRKYSLPAVQIIKELKREQIKSGVEIMKLKRFLTELAF